MVRRAEPIKEHQTLVRDERALQDRQPTEAAQRVLDSYKGEPRKPAKRSSERSTGLGKVTMRAKAISRKKAR